MSRAHTLAVVSLTACLAAIGRAEEVRLSPRTTVRFATVEEGRRILSTADKFVEALSPFDRAVRLQTDREVSRDEYLNFVVSHVRPWQDDERDSVVEALEAIRAPINRLTSSLPKEIWLVNTTGKEEGGAAYTRANAIVLPQGRSGGRQERLQRLLAHEMFHILSRHDPRLRTQLYAIIGFYPCNEIQLPSSLASRRITNPDAPHRAHYMNVTAGDKAVAAVPVLISSHDRYDSQHNKRLLDYVQFRLLAIEETAGEWQAALTDGRPTLFETKQVSGFHEQIGRNTGYIIHPEEILADNFAHLVMGKENLPSPQIVRELASRLVEAKNSKAK